VRHTLLVAPLDEEHLIPGLVQCLAETAAIAMPEYSQEAWDQAPASSVSTCVLPGQVPDDRLAGGEGDR
jgi:hypothetical protein